MLAGGVLDSEFYKMATSQGNTLSIAGVEDYPIEITNGVRIDRKDIRCEHEEADPIIAQMAILASLNNESVLTITEDTDVFSIVLHFYVTHECKHPMYMKSPKSHMSVKNTYEDCTVIDIKETAKKHHEIAKYILQIHALTGADCIPALFRIGKKRALNTLTCFNNESKSKTSSGFFNLEILAPVGDISADINDVLAAGSQFLIGCYGKTYATSCKTMTEARIKMWRKKISAGPVKLCEIPPTNESSGENIKRSHYQVAH